MKKGICVYCSSSDAVGEIYFATAKGGNGDGNGDGVALMRYLPIKAGRADGGSEGQVLIC